MENIILQSGEVSPEYSEAVRTHQRIMANGEICAQSLCEICKDLKKMRDEKLYAEFGYESFDEYCEKMAGIKARMAYNYISTIERLGTSVLQSNARLGITKLELIAGMNPVERAEKLENGDFDGMSVSEIRELVKKSKDQGEQISILETQIAELKSEAEETDAQQGRGHCCIHSQNGQRLTTNSGEYKNENKICNDYHRRPSQCGQIHADKLSGGGENCHRFQQTSDHP